jgi:hypothetical protein
MSLCARCNKTIKPFTSNKRQYLNYKERKLHLKCWKEKQTEYWFNQIFLKNGGKL